MNPAHAGLRTLALGLADPVDVLLHVILQHVSHSLHLQRTVPALTSDQTHMDVQYQASSRSSAP